MATVTVDEMQRDFAGYLHRVEAGETLVVLDHDRPVAAMTPVTATGQARRPVGLAAGQFAISDDFDDALPDDILDEFEGK